MCETQYTELVSAVNRLLPLAREALAHVSTGTSNSRLVADLYAAIHRVSILTDNVDTRVQHQGTIPSTSELI